MDINTYTWDSYQRFSSSRCWGFQPWSIIWIGFEKWVFDQISVIVIFFSFSLFIYLFFSLSSLKVFPFQFQEGSLHTMKVIKLILVPLVLLLWLSFALYFVSTFYKETWIAKETEASQFLICFWRTVVMFLLVSYGGKPSRNTFTLLLEIITMTAGLIFAIFVMCK